ncbi:thioredoxin domain-containing protein [Thiolapillus sp.]|uniref:thioredoxin domain-containing protein n=1 Tax=Thiolapillus sp. TaxID=2017437 RepID=UPI003AF477E4
MEPKNRLASALSPYLQQHAHNPVDWWPWCPEALQAAREQDRPILLSIGYSACHWCHVMAHESFEDEQTASLMNELFVNIKVDREERPDLDKLYQHAHQLLAGRSGGWPLTVFLDPHTQVPFYSGTYFPPRPRSGLPGFPCLLKNIATAWQQQRQAIEAQGSQVIEALNRQSQVETDDRSSLDDTLVDRGVSLLLDQFDGRHGGFGSAPKFPHPQNLRLLLTRNADQSQARQAALFTLSRMIGGGVFDQLGGGFYRYAVDDAWMIPHFEKMLYDNGPLLQLCARAWRLTGKPAFRHAAETTAQWLMTEMQHPDGGYFSSLDADSEGEEGKYYVWSRREVRELLSKDQYQAFSLHYGIDRPANFEGRWHLHVERDPEDVARQLQTGQDTLDDLLDSARNLLLSRRQQRTAPGRDEKILTAWNALTIEGMAAAGMLLNRPDWVDSAESALSHLQKKLWHNGRLLAACKDGQGYQAAYLDDHAFLIQAILTLLQARWNSPSLQWAMTLADQMIAHFEDKQQGGFYFTADDQEPLIQRPRGLMDEAIPSGNGIAALALQHLGHLTGRQDYLDAAERTLEAATGHLQQIPHASPSLLLALEEYLSPAAMLVIRGPEPELSEWCDRALACAGPRLMLYAIDAEDHHLPPILEARQHKNTAAWLCRGTECLPPAETLDRLESLLRQI